MVDTPIASVFSTHRHRPRCWRRSQSLLAYVNRRCRVKEWKPLLIDDSYERTFSHIPISGVFTNYVHSQTLISTSSLFQFTNTCLECWSSLSAPCTNTVNSMPVMHEHLSHIVIIVVVTKPTCHRQQMVKKLRFFVTSSYANRYSSQLTTNRASVFGRW